MRGREFLILLLILIALAPLTYRYLQSMYREKPVEEEEIQGSGEITTPAFSNESKTMPMNESKPESESASSEESAFPVYPAAYSSPIPEELLQHLSIPPNMTCYGFLTYHDAKTIFDWYRHNMGSWNLEKEIQFSPSDKPGEIIYSHYYRRDDEGLLLIVVYDANIGGSFICVIPGKWMEIEGIKLQESGEEEAEYFPELGSGPINFTVFPVNIDEIEEIWPLGHLNPPGHTFPTDHAYIIFKDQKRLHEIRAPADGIINWIYHRRPGDYEIRIMHTNTFISTFDHVTQLSDKIMAAIGDLPPGEWRHVKIPIEAGEVICMGPSPASESSIDWGVFDYDVTLRGFIHPEYYGESVHAVFFLYYFDKETRERVWPLVTRKAPPRGGKIDYDQPGRLVGNWFLEGRSPEDDEAQLSFVYDMDNPTQIRIGIGGSLSIPPGLYAVVGNKPDPAEVTPENGTIVYRLVGAPEFSYTERKATLIVQVLEGELIKVEAFEGHLSNPEFTDKALYYVR